ncbi:MAG: tyrosine-type recombinase/integrase [Phycisphaerae bacterium]
MPKGPPTSFVRDARGNVINGLRIQTAKNRDGRTIDRFYALYGDAKRKYFGNSENKRGAILRYRQWEARQERDTVSFPGKKLKLSEIDGGLEAADRQREIEITIDGEGDFDVAQLIPSDAFWEVVRDQILTNPQLAAQKTGIEQLAYLHRLQPPPPSKALEDIVTLYLDDKRAELTPAEWKNSRTWWDEFREITGAETVAELDRPRFRKYRIEILDIMKARARSNAWARSRFGKVKTIISHALDEADFSQEDRAVLELRSLLKQPSKPAPNPIDITPAELRKVLSKADDWEAALILTALNCAYYPVDCQRLQWSMINFAKGTIRFDRTKATGRAKGPVPRVAVLWQRTIRAMKKLDRHHDHVFVSTYGRPVHVETVRRHWIAMCERAKITRGITFANLRDSALTAAAESTDPVVPVQQYHVLAGHVAKGVDDSYITRHPRFVQTACRAIENAYFSRTKRRTRQ